MAELQEIAFAIESQRENIARAVAGAVHAREVQARQERRGRRERHSSRQDRHADVLKQARQSSGASGAGASWKPFAMKAEAAAITRPKEGPAGRHRRDVFGVHEGMSLRPPSGRPAADRNGLRATLRPDQPSPQDGTVQSRLATASDAALIRTWMTNPPETTPPE